MIPSKLLSWSIILIMPLITVGFLISYFGLYSGPQNQAGVENHHAANLSERLGLVHVASAQDSPVDLSVGQTIFPVEGLMPSQPIVYSLFITNNSPISLSSVLVSNILPSQVVSATIITAANGSNIQELSGYPDYLWQIDNLAAETRADFYIVARMDANLSEPGTMQNVLNATVPGDTVESNNSSSLRSELIVPEISFEAAELSFTEKTTVVHVLVNLAPGNPYGTTFVDFGTSSVFSAANMAASLDFDAVSGTVAFVDTDETVTTIAVELFDDYIDEGNEAFQLYLANPRGGFLAGGGLITITIEDNDSAGISVSPPLLSVAEGGKTEQYTVVLNTQPIAPVAVAVQSKPQLEAVPAEVTFTPENWDIVRTININAVDDLVAEGVHNGSVSHQVTSADGKYNSFVIDEITAGIIDNDLATFNLATTVLTVTEGPVGTASSYSMSLGAGPTRDIVVAIDVEEPLIAAPSQLTFTPDNWDQDQVVFISTLDDSVISDVPDSVVHRVLSDDPAYGKVKIPNIALKYVDNDSPGVRITATNPLTAAEGVGDLSYEVSLNTEPEQPVVIELTTDAEQVIVEPDLLTFDSSNWDQVQPLTVTVIDDQAAEGDHSSTIAHNPQSNDPVYDQLESTDVVIQIIDNDLLLFMPFTPINVLGE